MITINGGGLAGSLLFLLLKEKGASVQLFDRELHCAPRTWCFHGTDVPPALWPLLRPLVQHSWAAHEVRFPAYTRVVPGGYYCLRSGTVREFLAARYGRQLHLGFSAPPPAIEATGWAEVEEPCGYQKFLGQWIETDEPHGVQLPLLMDATVPQRDGFRFFYLLPASETELLVEDTFYSDHAGFPKDYSRSAIARYLKDRGIAQWRVVEEESGSLPLAFAAAPPRPGAVGTAAGLVHPVTGYTMPLLLAQLEAVAALEAPTQENVRAALDAAALDLRGRLGFYRFLNRMLFRSAGEKGRRAVLERFYRLPAPLVSAFYGARLSPLQKLRLLSGKPPVPVAKALREAFSG